MKFQDQLIKNLASRYNKDERVIKEIVYSPLKFTNRLIQSPKDNRPVRIRYFGAFVQKTKFNKSLKLNNMVDILLDNIEEVLIIMVSILHFPISSTESAKNIIESARDSNDFDKLKMIWDAYMEYGVK